MTEMRVRWRTVEHVMAAPRRDVGRDDGDPLEALSVRWARLGPDGVWSWPDGRRFTIERPRLRALRLAGRRVGQRVMGWLAPWPVVHVDDDTLERREGA